MIDIANRQRAADLLQQFVRKEKTGVEVFEQWPSSDDPAVSEIGYHLTVDGIVEAGTIPESRRAGMLSTVNRCIRFLESDLPYGWPRDLTYRRIVLSGCLLYTPVILLPAAAVVWLAALILPVPPPAGGFICSAMGVLCGVLMYVFVVPMLHSWRMSRELTGDEQFWPFRNSGDAARGE